VFQTRRKGSVRGATAIERVGQPTVQPSLAAYAVVLAVDGFTEHVRIVASQTQNLLFQPAYAPSGSLPASEAVMRVYGS
jgi:hypothetical protein